MLMALTARQYCEKAARDRFMMSSDHLREFDVYQSILPDLPSGTRVYFNDNDFLYQLN